MHCTLSMQLKILSCERPQCLTGDFCLVRTLKEQRSLSRTRAQHSLLSDVDSCLVGSTPWRAKIPQQPGINIPSQPASQPAGEPASQPGKCVTITRIFEYIKIFIDKYIHSNIYRVIYSFFKHFLNF